MATLLIVDDEEATAFGLQAVLEQPGCNILAANSFSEAKKMLESNDVDILLTDVRLSGTYRTEGLDLLAYTKKSFPKIRVILMTAYGDPETMQKAYDLKADFYLEKPVELTLLGNIISQAEKGCSDGKGA